MCTITTIIKNEDKTSRQLELYLLYENQMTGKDLAELYKSRFVCQEVKDAIEESLTQMNTLKRRKGFSEYINVIKSFNVGINGPNIEQTSIRWS